MAVEGLESQMLSPILGTPQLVVSCKFFSVLLSSVHVDRRLHVTANVLFDSRTAPLRVSYKWN